MTAQVSEMIYYNGSVSSMYAEPLENYLKTHGMDRSTFTVTSSACWRGYRGAWKLKDDMLFLVNFKGNIGYNDQDEMLHVGLDYLFPHQTEVFADWFSGTVRIPQGELLEYIHLPYASVYETEILLTFENGRLITETIKNNAKKYNRTHSLFHRVIRWAVQPLHRYLENKLAERESEINDDTFIGNGK